MTKKVKRTISLIIAAIMLLSTMSVLALAADTYASVYDKEFGPHDCVPARAADGTPAWQEVNSLYLQPTCIAEGRRVYVVKCSICGKELERITEVLPNDDAAHVPADVKTIEGVVQPTCKDEGEYYEVTRCKFCNAVLEKKLFKVARTVNHVPAAAVKENCIPATCAATGSYDSVIYCKVCKIELQRTMMIVPKTNYHTSTTIRPLSATPDYVQLDDNGNIVAARWIIGNPGAAYSNRPATYTRTCADGEDICVVCGELLNPAIPHMYDKGVYLTAADRPTTTQQGKLTYTCLVCGFRKTEATKPIDTILGDVDGDGRRTTADARFILRYSVGLGDFDKVINSDTAKFADIDTNKKIEPADARLCLRLAVGLPM